MLKTTGAITISGTDLIKLVNYNYLPKGIPKMKGINKKVVLDVGFGDYIKDHYGNKRQASLLAA